MLVLSRKVGEKIIIDGGIVVTIARIQADKVRIGIEAPQDVVVHREEIARRIDLIGPRVDAAAYSSGPARAGDRPLST